MFEPDPDYFNSDQQHCFLPEEAVGATVEVQHSPVLTQKFGHKKQVGASYLRKL